MKIKTLEKPTLKKVKMNCDEIIDKKLTEYPMINDVWSRNSYNVVVGSMGSGKTSLVTSLIKTVFKKCFENIYVIIPSSSLSSLEDNIYEKYLPPNQIYHDLTEDNLLDIYEKLQENSSDCYNSFLFIDDFQYALKDATIIKTLQKIITKHRHLRTTIFLLQQNFQALAKPLRELVSNLILFNLGKSQLEKIFLEQVQMKQKQFEELVKISFVEPHDWVLINLNRSKKIYRNFDEIEIEE